MSQSTERRAALILAASVFLLAAPTFAARHGSTSSAASRQASERAARKACMTGDPATGVSILADLFLDTKEPTYIFNQGRCLEQNRKYEDAIARFEEYLVTASAILSRADKEAAEKHIAACRENLARERGMSPAPVAPLAPRPAPTVEPAPDAPMVAQPAPETKPQARRAGAGLRIAGIATASVGVAALVTAIVLNVKANGIIHDMTAVNNGYSPGKADDHDSYKTAAWVGYGVGAACVAAGAVLFGLGLRSGAAPSSNLALAPVVGPDHAGAMLAGGF